MEFARIEKILTATVDNQSTTDVNAISFRSTAWNLSGDFHL
jgi:hypothetical protein